MSKKTLEHFRASMWWNPLTVDTLTLRSPLTPDECTQRMHAHTYQSLWRRAFWEEHDPDLLFTGMVGDNLFMLTKFTPGFRNSFRPILHGTILLETGGGACIRLALSEFPIAMLFALVYPFYVFSALLSFQEQEFLVQFVAQILEASDYPEGYVPSIIPSYPGTLLPARVGGSSAGRAAGGAAACVICEIIWALAWLMLIGPVGSLLLIDVLGRPFAVATVLGSWMVDGVSLGFWFGGVAFFLYRAHRLRPSNK
jgi:hypothetical protein